MSNSVILWICPPVQTYIYNLKCQRQTQTEKRKGCSPRKARLKKQGQHVWKKWVLCLAGCRNLTITNITIYLLLKPWPYISLFQFFASVSSDTGLEFLLFCLFLVVKSILVNRITPLGIQNELKTNQFHHFIYNKSYTMNNYVGMISLSEGIIWTDNDINNLSP